VKNSFFDHNAAPGTVFNYSNMNGGLMGAMIEALSGQSVNAYMQENVFNPLEINAAYHAALLRDTSDISNQLTKQGKNHINVKRALKSIKDYEDTCDPRAHTNITTDNLFISANGLHRIIVLLENGGELDGVHILKEETVQLMMQDQHLIPGSSVRCESLYGLSMIRVYDMPGGTWYGHQGRLQGLSSNIYFQPDTGLSVVVIANGYKRASSVDDVVTLAREVMEKAQELIP